MGTTVYSKTTRLGSIVLKKILVLDDRISVSKEDLRMNGNGTLRLMLRLLHT